MNKIDITIAADVEAEVLDNGVIQITSDVAEGAMIVITSRHLKFTNRKGVTFTLRAEIFDGGTISQKAFNVPAMWLALMSDVIYDSRTSTVVKSRYMSLEDANHSVELFGVVPDTAEKAERVERMLDLHEIVVEITEGLTEEAEELSNV